MRRIWAGLPWRPLPCPVVPMADETIGSYLSRLAEANRLDPDALRAHITGDRRKTAPIPVGTLAALASQPERSLRHAIPGLDATVERSGLHLESSPGPDAPARPACQLCAAARGHTGTLPRCHSLPHGAICLKHRRWLGNGIDSSGGQLDLTGQPVIVEANLTHRRLARRHGCASTDDAYRLAHDVCDVWSRRMERQEQFTELIADLHPGRSSFAYNDPAVHAARYPQTVALTRLLLTPDWKTVVREQWDRPEYVIRDLWRRASPNLYASTGRRHWPAEPLIMILPDGAHSMMSSDARRCTRGTISFGELPQLRETNRRETVSRI